MLFFKKKHKPQSETDLLKEYRQTGDLSVLGKLYEPQMEMVFAIAMKYCKDEDDAKDTVMQIFEELIPKLKQHEVENFKAWLGMVARNFCLMALRKKNLVVADGEIFADDDSSENHFMEFSTIEHLNDDFDVEQNLTKLEDCLKTLNSEQKQAVELFFMQEKTYQEVSQLTGFEINKVKSYLQNGKRNLKNCIENK
ncbi:sigma-70 family RNA polymerase sigma factor [Arcicella sp. LKC2W]|uniref:RNA polymerase sigma factor n=1 Tax=Arcicella sp. LKC2W TaxID=2984198 RepID=UPI002B20612B|nr:sigma-70 family RNA polymerase sigma factor [Arcicella sp. LKC2W]MEA5459297.1 sigma-70 family RNA polymerase sigma factor [Arcicella sp. LKC2W]